MPFQESDRLSDTLERAMSVRAGFLNGNHGDAYRLFAGFYEGWPELVVDVFDRTLVLYGYGVLPEESGPLMNSAQDILIPRLAWVECVVQKIRSAPELERRRGVITFGQAPANQGARGGYSVCG